jgi:hypothetical protein
MRTLRKIVRAWRGPISSRRILRGADRGRRIRLLATLMIRDEVRFLPGLLRNLASQVDGIVALDDGSRDGGDRLLEESPLVLELLRIPPDRPGWDQPGNHRRVVEAALRHGAEWIIAVDADERLEIDFRARAERVIRRGGRRGLSAFGLRFLELWDSPRAYRIDGIWGRKFQPRLFRARADHLFDERPLHCFRAPLQGRVDGAFPLADLILYHLRMVRPEDRDGRRRRNEQLDPEARCQPGIGYAYLTDETGLRLRAVPRRRRYQD